EIARARGIMKWPHAPFEVPPDIAAAWDARAHGAAVEADWQQRFERYRAAHPELAAELMRRIAGELPPRFANAAADVVASTRRKAEPIATRKASQNALATLAPILPELLGGSADLAHSNLTNHPKTQPITRDPAGNAIFYGVREFGMTAVANGIA